MDYYRQHREQRLLYQKEYNKQSENYKTYQQEYFQLNKERIMKENKIRRERNKKRKPLPQYKIELLERMLRRKLKDYYATLYQKDVSHELTAEVISESHIKDVVVKPFEGFTVRNNKFVLSFN